MALKPCIVCGTPANGSRCADHRTDHKPSARARGYDTAWDRLSKRARRMQPFCLDCGSTEDLQADHLPSAWQRRADGKPIRLQDIAIRCGPCNRAAGPARGNTVTRGDAPNETGQDSGGRRNPRYTPLGVLRARPLPAVGEKENRKEAR